MRTTTESALLIALLFKRSGKTRARVSIKTVRKLSQRKYLRVAFIDNLIDELDDLGFIFIELSRGGFGLIPASSLDGAPAITVKKFLKDDLKRLRKEEINFTDIEDELGLTLETDEDEEEEY